MSLLNDINLWLSDHGLDTNPAETQAFYDFVNDGYLLSEFIDSVYAEIAARWDGIKIYPFSPDNTIEIDHDGNVTFVIPVFQRMTGCDVHSDFEEYPYWRLVPNQMGNYYHNASTYYDLPYCSLSGQSQYSKTLPNLSVVLVVRRFILPVLVDAVREAGVSCHVHEDEKEVTFICEWNYYNERCPIETEGLPKLTLRDIYDICVPGWKITASEISVFEEDRIIMDLYNPEQSQDEKLWTEQYFVYWRGERKQVPPNMMLDEYGDREIDYMFRAQKDLENIVMLLG